MTEQTTNGPGPRRERRWPKILLAVSLTLNVLVLAVVAGAHFRGDHDARNDRRAPPPNRSVLREGGFMPFFEAMPREARQGMTEAFRNSGLGKGPDRAVLAADLRNFVDVLRREPFEAADLALVLDAPNARAQERIAAGRAILIEQIVAMSPEDRAAFADGLEQRFQGALDRAGKPGSGH